MFEKTNPNLRLNQNYSLQIETSLKCYPYILPSATYFLLEYFSFEIFSKNFTNFLPSQVLLFSLTIFVRDTYVFNTY